MAFSNLEKAMGAIIGIDLLAPGTTRAVARTLVGAAARASPVAARSVGLTNPYGLGLGLGIGALQTAPGQALLEAAEERGRADRLRLERFVQDTLATAEFKTKRAVKRKKSAFNNAVSAGMKAVKGSTSYGKKGVISNAKKAFSVVTKVVSGIRKGRKAPTSGIRRKIFNAAKPKMIVSPAKIKLGTGKGR
jgi:hypothetical protein